MSLKLYTCIAIITVGLLLSCNQFVWGREIGERKVFTDQPYIFHGARTFSVGTLETVQDSGWGFPIPRIQDEEIYNFAIKNSLTDSFGMFAMTNNNFSFKVYKKKHIFFTGYIKDYVTNHLINQNQQIDWLKNISLVHVPVFDIEQMIPVENDLSVLSIDIPDILIDKFEISVTIKNTSQRQLVDSALNINISRGPYKIIEGDTYFSKTFKDKYEKDESKVYHFQIESKPSKSFELNDFEISVAFAGYGLEGDSINPEIFPLYAKKSNKYEYQLLKVQKN